MIKNVSSLIIGKCSRNLSGKKKENKKQTEEMKIGSRFLSSDVGI
jgi:hypothetical protein